ncbi:MAG: tRNA 2-thiouridine(34) synthase MnmA [Deltaproteobacteria bacterium]|nr:tRNA 2-thiouridine(34) synthase MnmA [Deltaproteobacteria bacterium]
MTQLKIGIAMSGGVDSTVSAAILHRQGFAVHGFFMRLPLKGVEEQIIRVRAVAKRLEIPLSVIDMRMLFPDTVIAYFVNQYLHGLTPNPCVICNRRIKFGVLMESMMARGMDRMATGHYARIRRESDTESFIMRGLDEKKDQSYFLCRLSAAQLNRMILPLGEFTKKKVYRMAADMGLAGVHGPESQDVCFLSGDSVAAFLQEQGINDVPGDIVTREGRVLGRHLGIWHYTIGQRHGLGLPDTTPWYVMELDAADNRVIVCKNEELFSSSLMLREVCWTGTPPALPWDGLVQLRSRHRASPATVDRDRRGRWIVSFTERQRAVTPGQFAVFYAAETVLGSGVIAGRLPDADGDHCQ